MRDTIAAVMADVDEVFRYSDEERPQDRARAYLDRRGIGRTATDTAMQCAVRDMARRAEACGRADVESGMAGVQRRLYAAARELMEIAEGVTGDGE